MGWRGDLKNCVKFRGHNCNNRKEIKYEFTFQRFCFYVVPCVILCTVAPNLFSYLKGISWLIDKSHHSSAEHRASTRIFHPTLFLASVLISAQVFLIPLASSNTVLRHVFHGLPLPRLPWWFHSRSCLAMSSDGFRSVWPSHLHLRFLICTSILGCFVLFIRNLVRPENYQYFP